MAAAEAEKPPSALSREGEGNGEEAVPGARGNEGETPAASSRKTQDRRAPRRATLPAPAGSDPAPYDPPLEPRRESENDDRLQGDRPPHWG